MTDEEILKTFKVSNEGNNIRVKFFEDISDKKANVRVAELVCEQVYKILDKNTNQKFYIIMDLLDLGNSGTSTRKARETYAKIINRDQIDKIAVIGGSVVMKTIANFIMYLTNKKNSFRFFENNEDAKKWLEYESGK